MYKLNFKFSNAQEKTTKVTDILSEIHPMRKTIKNYLNASGGTRVCNVCVMMH